MIYNFSLKFLGETNMTCGTLILERFSSSDKKTRSETVVARAIVFEAASKVTAKLKCLFKWRSTMLTPNTAEKENITCQKRERSVFTRALGSATCQRIMVACQAGQVFPARQVFPAKAGIFGRQVFENSRSIFFKKM
jgi:hypothetical protein